MTNSGYPFSLARRADERFPQSSGVGKASEIKISQRLEEIETMLPRRSRTQRTMTFSTLSEKPQAAFAGEASTAIRDRRIVRTLPFSKETFRDVTQKFYIHGSVARVVNRADMPVFSSTRVEMGGYPAYGNR
jgi:hypothetical protein